MPIKSANRSNVLLTLGVLFTLGAATRLVPADFAQATAAESEDEPSPTADAKTDDKMANKAMSIEELLKFYMGKNTPDRQEFIINNLKVELDLIEENQL